MPEIRRPGWDPWAMAIAAVVSTRSVDPSTKHGSVLLNSEHLIRGAGFNGFPKGLPDWQMPMDEARYPLIIHAERNGVESSELDRTELKDATLYVTGPPCLPCMCTLIHRGVGNIVYGHQMWASYYRGNDSMGKADVEEGMRLARLGGVGLKKYEEPEDYGMVEILEEALERAKIISGREKPK